MKHGRGLVLGKFMPPHTGHEFLIDFAQQQVEQLTIVVGTLAAEPIAGALRYQWMRDLYPNLNVLHLEDENPQHPEEHPEFWRIWQASLERILPWRPDYVFASESYGRTLAKVLGAQFVPVDIARSNVPISASQIRAHPHRHWQYLSRPARAHYAYRVCVFGPESTGKTTLCSQLAEHFQTIQVSEYARTFLEYQQGELRQEDLTRIARGQAASEDALVQRCNRILVCDTDTLATQIWSEVLYGSVHEEVRALAQNRSCDFYLLMDTDLPWVEDEVRYLPDGGPAFLALCKKTLEQQCRPYVLIKGSGDQRCAAAVQAIKTQFALGSVVD